MVLWKTILIGIVVAVLTGGTLSGADGGGK